MYRIAIVEDTQSDAELLGTYLSCYAKERGIELKRTMFTDGDAFLTNYGTGFDIVLMDIEMPGIDGVATAKKLRERDENVTLIFVTHLANHALDGYEVRALDFLVKPVEYPNFCIKLDRALDSCEKNRAREVAIPTVGGVRRVRLDRLYYIEVMDHTLVFHMQDGDLSVRGSIKECERKLAPYDFVRCNNSFLVNLRYVSELDGSDVLLDGHRIPVGRTKKKEFLQRLAQYLGDTVL